MSASSIIDPSGVRGPDDRPAESGERSSMSARGTIQHWLTALVLLASCGVLTSAPSRHMRPASGILLHETFADLRQVQARWLLTPPRGTASAMTIEGSAVRLTASGENI